MKNNQEINIRTVDKAFRKVRKSLKKDAKPFEFYGFYNYCHRCDDVHLFNKETSPKCLSLLKELLTNQK